MKVGELFVNLGIKGGEKTIGTLGKTGDMLKSASKHALLLKAGLIGAFYGMEKLFSKSGQMGTELHNYNKALGLSTETLQRYQYAADQVGATNEEVMSTFESLQKTYTQMAVSGKQPAGIGFLARYAGKSDATVEDFVRNPEKALQWIQKGVQGAKAAGHAEGVINEMLSGLVDSRSMIAGLYQGVFNDENMKNALVRSQSGIDKLHGANVQKLRMGRQWDHSMGNLAILADREGILKNVTDMIPKIEAAVAATFKLVGAFEKLVNVLSGSNKGFATIFDSFKWMIETATDAIDILSGFLSDESGVKKIGQEKAAAWKTEMQTLHDFMPDWYKDTAKQIVNPFGAPTKNAEERAQEAIRLRREREGRLPPQSSNAPNNINIEQSFNFQHDGRNANDVGAAASAGVKHAYNNIYSRVRSV